MKRRFLIAILVAAMALSTGAFAATNVFGFYLNTNVGSLADYTDLDLGTTDTWTVWYTGSATISPTTAPATLTGNLDGRVWQYQYSTDNVHWTTINNLVGTFSGTPNNIGNSKTENGGPIDVVARYLRIRYDVTLSSSAQASASGSASVTAVSAPEPTALLGLGALVAPLGLMLRRRRA